MSKSFWGIIIAVIIVFIGIFTLTGNKSNSSSSKTSTGTVTQHTEGTNQDHITLVEYGDYQCPFCGEYYPILKQVQQEFNSQISFQFRNFPLTSLHPNAFAAARAAEAAGLQGKFWDMHDILYEENDAYLQDPNNANSWVPASDPTPFFDAYAKQLGLNVTQFKADYSSEKVNNLISADQSEGTKLGVDATPTFFLDGKQVSVGESVTQFETLIKKEIAKKSGQATSSSSSSASTGTTAQTKAAPTPAKKQ